MGWTSPNFALYRLNIKVAVNEDRGFVFTGVQPVSDDGWECAIDLNHATVFQAKLGKVRANFLGEASYVVEVIRIT